MVHSRSQNKSISRCMSNNTPATQYTDGRSSRRHMNTSLEEPHDDVYSNDISSNQNISPISFADEIHVGDYDIVINRSIRIPINADPLKQDNTTAKTCPSINESELLPSEASSYWPSIPCGVSFNSDVRNHISSTGNMGIDGSRSSERNSRNLRNLQSVKQPSTAKLQHRRNYRNETPRQELFSGKSLSPLRNRTNRALNFDESQDFCNRSMLQKSRNTPLLTPNSSSQSKRESEDSRISVPIRTARSINRQAHNESPMIKLPYRCGRSAASSARTARSIQSTSPTTKMSTRVQRPSWQGRSPMTPTRTARSIRSVMTSTPNSCSSSKSSTTGQLPRSKTPLKWANTGARKRHSFRVGQSAKKQNDVTNSTCSSWIVNTCGSIQMGEEFPSQSTIGTAKQADSDHSLQHPTNLKMNMENSFDLTTKDPTKPVYDHMKALRLVSKLDKTDAAVNINLYVKSNNPTLKMKLMELALDNETIWKQPNH